jgi:hypothetical protein
MSTPLFFIIIQIASSIAYLSSEEEDTVKELDEIREELVMKKDLLGVKEAAVASYTQEMSAVDTMDILYIYLARLLHNDVFTLNLNDSLNFFSLCFPFFVSSVAISGSRYEGWFKGFDGRDE